MHGDDKKPTTVLVGEDRANWRNQFCELLKEEGYSVLSARYGDEVRVLAPQADVIVLDISMPMGDGGPESRTTGLDVLADLQQQYVDHPAIQAPIIRSMWTPDDFKESAKHAAVRCVAWVSRNEPIVNLLALIEQAAEGRRPERV